MKIEEISKLETELLLPILAEADEDEERMRSTLLDPACIAYACWLNDQPAGAAAVDWKHDKPSEIIYIAVGAASRGRGYGRQMLHFLQEELRRRGGNTLLVGTANASLDNIAFYQKCGFRMFEVRRDYFAYIQPPVSENGIVLRDMLVFSYHLE